MAGVEAWDVSYNGQDPLFRVVGRLLHRTQPHPIPPDHSVHEPPFLVSSCGRVGGQSQVPRPRARVATVLPCDPTHARATEPATKLLSPRSRSPVRAQETGPALAKWTTGGG